MGNNLPPGVSVNDLPGNYSKDYKVPRCLLCVSENRDWWGIEVSGMADGEEPAVVCQTHGELDDGDWEVTTV